MVNRCASDEIQPRPRVAAAHRFLGAADLCRLVRTVLRARMQNVE